MANSWQNFVLMAFALAKENQAFIERMIELGRFNNQSEVVREALRRMERAESSYLNPVPLSEAEIRQIYGRNPESDNREVALARAAMRSIRRRRSRR
jgi:putative addiction module CopG family antidote